MIKKFERIHFLHFIRTNIYEMWIIKKKTIFVQDNNNVNIALFRTSTQLFPQKN